LAAQHQQQRFVGARPVGAASKRIDRRGRRGGRGRGRRGQARCGQRVDDQAAGEADTGGGELTPGDRLSGDSKGGAGQQRRQGHRGDDDGKLEHGGERVLVAAAAAQHRAQGHDVAVLEHGLGPHRGRHGAPVERGRDGVAGEPEAAGLMSRKPGQGGAAAHRDAARLAGFGGQRMGPQIGGDVPLQRRVTGRAGRLHRRCTGVAGAVHSHR